MKLVLVSVSANTQLSGVSRHVANLARCLLSHSDVQAIHLIAAPWERTLFREAIAHEDPRLHIHSVYVGASSLARNLWFWLDLPSIANQLDADIVHLGYPAPLHRRELSCPAVVSVHDLYPWDIPENWGFPKVLFNRMVFRQCVRAADALACMSDATLNRLREKEPMSLGEKTRRIYNCVELARVRLGRGPLPGIVQLFPSSCASRNTGATKIFFLRCEPSCGCCARRPLTLARSLSSLEFPDPRPPASTGSFRMPGSRPTSSL
jgi:glycosyltransferase involved in cell wall biosynthesis